MASHRVSPNQLDKEMMQKPNLDKVKRRIGRRIIVNSHDQNTLQAITNSKTLLSTI